MTDDVFRALCRRYGTEPDRSGEAPITCPSCGKPPKPGQTHCTMSVRGWHCFVCGAGGTIKQLAEHEHIETPKDWRPPKRKPQRKRSYYWKQHGGSATLARITRLPVSERLDLWREYKPVTAAMVREHHLGYGTLPASRCHHNRLLVPLMRRGKLVGIRGRAIDCDCGKWLSPAGNEATLYNHQALGKGQIVIVCENPIDALLVGEAYDAVGVATLSVSYWQDAWLDMLADAEPAKIVVAYDNHRPGNGGGRAEWLADHERDITPNGIKLCNRLLKAGLPAMLYDWGDAPLGADIGDVLAKIL